MKFIKKAAAMLCAGIFLSACVSGDVLESASSSSAPSVQSEIATSPELALQGETQIEGTIGAQRPDTDSSTLLAAVDPSGTTETPVEAAIGETDGFLQPPAVKGPKKTYLINGLMSAVPFIGYGFRNLKKKMPGAKLYSYLGVVEGPAAIAPEVIKDATTAWRADPTTRINLIGISLGADLITVIAEKLNAKGVPVAYLGIVDGTNLRPITANVKVADNLTCSNLDCTKARARLAKGNTSTILTRKVYRSSHIPLGNHDELHARVIAKTQ